MKFTWWYRTLSRHRTIGFEGVGLSNCPRPLLECLLCVECLLNELMKVMIEIRRVL